MEAFKNAIRKVTEQKHTLAYQDDVTPELFEQILMGKVAKPPTTMSRVPRPSLKVNSLTSITGAPPNVPSTPSRQTSDPSSISTSPSVPSVDTSAEERSPVPTLVSSTPRSSTTLPTTSTPTTETKALPKVPTPGAPRPSGTPSTARPSAPPPGPRPKLPELPKGRPTGRPPKQQQSTEEVPMDSLHMDAPPTDAPPMDAPPMDAPPLDAPPMDAPPMDASPPSSTVRVSKPPSGTKPPPQPMADPRSDLLAAIQKGAQLKKVDTDQIKKDSTAPTEKLGGLEAALKGSLQRYRKFVQEEDNDEEADNDEWD